MVATRRQPQVLLASCAELPTSNGDDTQLPAALAELGVQASWAVWDAPEADFAQADLVVLRSTWDYTRRRAEFLRWCESLPALANPARVVRWNTHKSYLVDLAAAGVAVVPTQVIAPGERAEWPEHEFVLKPAVGAGSRDAARFDPADPTAARAHLRTLHEQDRTAVVQPYQEAVDAEGETALVFLGGVFSHGFVKGPMLTPATAREASELFVPEGLRPTDPPATMRRAAEDALDAACGLLGLCRSELLYARVDLVRATDGEPLLLELELSEPSLGFRQTDSAAQRRFASAVRGTLARR
ncbi:hypothetical protein DFQ14_11155 [Halopolyspora algeriensis]|uniref:ATP-grasp domain-containing protein n=1 Tax=Halopolyspora algeriensis TaxID=1500506 RepID=A0A368VJJ7_9ACTN|nr:hypothetical protein [Halopolyspora algeriensis]RCW40406.1 hypothetical protein DFQ14_11155 [Halopolyspora algeriensis]TQM53690.1 hypothetical protein FHU43_1852 [Halopolyspora algeriensis]